MVSAPVPTASSARAIYEATSAVLGQEKARRQVAVLLERQLMVATGDLPTASGAIVAGRTGTGKTMLLRLACAACGLPFAEANATQYTDAGYVGLNLPQMFLPLLRAAQVMYDADNGTEGGPLASRSLAEQQAIIARAERGVVLLDEFDKWMLQGDDMSGRNVGKKLQAELLKMVEGTTEYVSATEDDLGIPFDTRKVLIVCCGAFVGLPQIVRRHLGADTPVTDQVIWEFVEPPDFVRFGLLPELAGRLSTHIFLRPMTETMLVEILNTPGGITDEYSRRFARYGVRWGVSDAGLRRLASHALSLDTGARGVENEMWTTFGEALFRAATGEFSEVRYEVGDPEGQLV